MKKHGIETAAILISLFALVAVAIQSVGGPGPVKPIGQTYVENGFSVYGGM
jgi:hypothetical protein